MKRTEIVEEPLKEIQKVGTNSGQAIIKASKEDQYKNDPNTMGNLAFMYESARRGVIALWNASTAGLAERRANNSIVQGRNLGVNEDFSSCDKWGQAVAKNYKNPSDTDKKAIAKQIQDCKLLMSKNYKDINPKIDNTKPDRNGNTQRIVKNGDIKSEDDKERDYRAQLSVIDKAGTRLNEIPSNWKYTDQDEKSKVVTGYDDNGKPNQVQDMRVDEQLGLFNNELVEASKDYAELKKVLPNDLKANPEDIAKQQIQPKSKRIDQIMELTPSVAEEFGLKKGPSRDQLPQDYEELQSKK